MIWFLFLGLGRLIYCYFFTSLAALSRQQKDHKFTDLPICWTLSSLEYTFPSSAACPLILSPIKPQSFAVFTLTPRWLCCLWRASEKVMGGEWGRLRDTCLPGICVFACGNLVNSGCFRVSRDIPLLALKTTRTSLDLL